jgi:hypothetical protein
MAPITDLITQRLRADREATMARYGIIYGDQLRQRLDACNAAIAASAKLTNAAETAERIKE